MDFFQKKHLFWIADYSETVHFWAYSYVSYGKRQKSCTLIVIYVILSCLTSLIFNSSAKLTGYFLANEEVVFCSSYLVGGIGEQALSC